MKPSESIVHYAATENQLVMMARLLEESSANLELTDTECNTPLIRAAIAGNEEMVKFLVEQNANVNAQNLFVSIGGTCRCYRANIGIWFDDAGQHDPARGGVARL